ncbi:MAG: hypothetical protein ACYTFG_00090 [Planctomycetota bacterium]|jgi:hypothetical protein
MAAYMSYHETPDSHQIVRWSFEEEFGYLNRGPGVELTTEDFGFEIRLRYWLVQRPDSIHSQLDVLLVRVEGAISIEGGEEIRGYRQVARRAGVSDEEVQKVLFETVDCEHQSRLFGHYEGGRDYIYAR